MRMDAQQTTTEATQAAPLPDITAADIAEAAANPSSFSVEGLSQSNRSLSELIAADRYLRALKRSRCRCHPLAGMVSHVIPPGTCDR